VSAAPVSTEPASTELAAARGARLRMAGWRRARKLLLPVAGFVAIVGIWQLSIGLAHVASYIVPRPTDVVRATLMAPGLLWAGVVTTAAAAAAGLALAAVIGVAGAIFLATSPVLQRSLFPYAIVLQTTPVIAVAPLVVIWLGANIRSIIVIVFLISFFPMLSNTLVGLGSADPDMRGLFRLYKASRTKTMLKLRVPGALPYTVAGLKIAGGLSVIGAIVAEYVAGVGGGQGGLGYLIAVSAQQLNTPYLVAAALSGSLLGLIFFGVIAVISKVVNARHDPGAGTEVRGGITGQVGG
jgi:NitT/TauT family transport system permease protein